MKVKMKNYSCLLFLIVYFTIGSLSQAQNAMERPVWAGLWIDRVNQFDGRILTDHISSYDIAGEAGRVQWRNVEPEPNEFDFGQILESLTMARDNDHYYYFVFWTGEFSPRWIYDHGVPEVEMTEPAHWGNQHHPYYLDEDYKFFVKRFMAEMAKYIAELPADLSERLAFIQPGFGSTGDRQLYKGQPVDPQYAISSDQYVDFMKEMTIALTEEFNKYPETKDIPFLWNVDDYDGSDPSQLIGIGDGLRGERLYAEWMHQNYNTNIRKQQFTIAIGYMANDEKSQDDVQRANFYGYNTGIPQFVRGEFTDRRFSHTDLAMVSREWYYYWTAISSVDRGLDAWEIEWEGLLRGYQEAFSFSNRYSYYKQASTSPYAFIALRDVLDYSDTERFPTNKYGSAVQDNEARVNAILAEYSKYGARNDDMDAVLNLRQHRYLLESKGLNDVVWNVIDRNYRRFITQIDPNETSVGLWRVGSKDEPYGRFARGFDVEKGKNTMYFDVDDQFFKGNQDAEVNNLKVRVIYYGEDEGSWELLYHAKDGTMKVAMDVTNEPGNGWLSKEVILEDALLDNGGENGADLILKNTGGTNVKFHLIELHRDLIIPGSETVNVGSINIHSYPNQLSVNETAQLRAAVKPHNSTYQIVKWSSSNPAVASISATGKITALAEGSVFIRASSFGDNYKDSVEIKIFDPTSGQSPYRGYKRTIPGVIQAHHYDEGGPGVAYFDTTEKEGNLNVRPEDNVDFRIVSGDTLITRAQNGEWVEYTIDVVEGYYDVTFFYISGWPQDCQVILTLDGEEITRFSDLTAGPDYLTMMEQIRNHVFIPGGEDKILRMSISQTNANVQINAFEFTPAEVVHVSDVSIESCPLEDLTVGDTHQLSANVEPADATDKSVSWSSSNEEVATVDETGLVTTLSAGDVTITVTTNDGDFTSTCVIGVIPSVVSVTGVSISNCPTELLEPDNVYQLIAHVIPEDADDKSVSWISSNEEVATVDETGLITLLSAGETTITVTTNDGDFTAECSITVEASTIVRQIDGAGQFVELFPNPASDVIHLGFSESASEKVISIFNTKGQLLFSKNTYNSNAQIDIREFNSEGMLIVKVISGAIAASFKVINK